MSPPSTDDSDTQPNHTRRRFLLGIGAATATLAGCASNDDTDDSPTDSFDPASALPYGKWLTTANDGMLFAYADLEALAADSSSGGSVPDSLEDPLALYPFLLGQTTVGLGQLSLSFAGLTRAIAPNADSESTVATVTVVNSTVVAEGTFATDELDERLTEPADATYGITYEQSGTIRGYMQYEATEVPESFSDEPPALAVAGETVVVSQNADQLERMLAAENGEQSRIYETNETVAQLLEQAGTGDLVVGEIGSTEDVRLAPRESFETDPQFEPRAGEDVVASLAFAESGDTVESQVALAADDLTESRRDTIETEFGTAAVSDSVSLTVEDNQLTVSGTYEAASLGLTGGGSDSSEDGGLSQAAAAELVSPDTLRFRYEPPRNQQFGELWVAATEETDAAALRLTTDSGNSTELRPQEDTVGANDSIAVPVDPDGDSVTVAVVDDEGASGELTTQSVPTADLSETAARQAVPEDALSFSYNPPNGGQFGSLIIEVVADTEADTLVAQPQEAPGLFTDRVGSLRSNDPVGAGTTLDAAVDPAGDEVIVYASVDGATGEVARWQGPS